MPALGFANCDIRKLRKKLRQIENLERLDRDLTEEEAAKVLRKTDIRCALLDLLSQQPPQEELPCDMSQDHDDQSYDSAYTEESSFNPLMPDCEEDSIEEESTGSQASIVEHGQVEHREERLSVHQDNSTDAEEKGTTVNLQKRKATEEPDQQKGTEPSQGGGPSLSRRGQGDGAPIKKSKKGEDVSRHWRGLSFIVQNLEGHNDFVRTLDTDGELLVSAGNDTMVKVWSLQTGVEQRSFGGHTGPVTAVVLLSVDASQALGEACDLAENDRLVVSGSLDCSIRIWSISTGQTIKSVYTYNPVTCLRYLEKASLLVSGSDGGKLELWSPVTGQSVQSFVAHEDGVSALDVQGEFVYTAAIDGVTKVFQLRDKNLHTMFVSENIKPINGGELQLRHIRCLTAITNKLYYGDDGMNVKVLDWKSAEVHKLTNHTTEFGTTDAICHHGNLLLSSGYDLDNGIGYVNVRSLPEEKYLCTLCDDDTSRIMCLTCHTDVAGSRTIVTGGMELKIWRQVKGKVAKDQESVFPADFDQRFSRPARNSDNESESELSASDNDDRGPYIPAARRVSSSSGDSHKGWFSWCAIL